MVSEYIGTVISTVSSPSPSNVDFVVTKGVVHRGQFVEIEHAEGTMLALITNVIKTNKYFERADSIKEFEARGNAIFEQFPAAEWEYIVANTRPLGVFTSSGVRRPSTPPSPGTKVRLANTELLKKFYGFDDNGLHLGKVEFHDLDVKLNLTRLLKKHLAVLSISGAGKSYAVSCLIEGLLDRKKEHGRIACVVFDPHGEYSSFAEPAKKGFTDYSDRALVVKGNQIRIGVPNLSIRILSGIIPGLSLTQRRELSRILAELKKDMRAGNGPFDFAKVKQAIVDDSEIKSNTKAALLAWLSELENMHLFAKMDLPSIRDLVMPGKLAVIDLSDIIDVKKKQIIVSYFAQKMFSERRKARIPPFLLIVEEAHQFCPERASEEQAISREIIRTIAREGRKFGASLCLISQRPVQLDTTALSQCNTKLILRITNPYDLKHIAESAEAIDQRSMDMITSLQVGEALIIGEAVGYPLFFKVRQRKSMPSKHEITLEEAALHYEEKITKRDSETEALL
ncbi:MAG: ATP-binding protein [Candidatus Diapherotrites archaeon]|nr:ATP-binding protein [Candidatus Diapherotrites archaeon]